MGFHDGYRNEGKGVSGMRSRGLVKKESKGRGIMMDVWVFEFGC